MSRRRKEGSLEGEHNPMEEKILENLIELQKVHINLAEKFDKLAKEISHLLSLFELTAQSFAKNPAVKMNETDKEFLDKIDKLLEQNKTIAKGLTLMEDHIRRKISGSPTPIQETQMTPTEQTTSEYTPSSPQRRPNRPLPKF